VRINLFEKTETQSNLIQTLHSQSHSQTQSQYEFTDVVRDTESKTHCLVFEYVNNTDYKSLFHQLTDHDVRYYIFQLLKVSD
jgi:serine/threonine protein kinase